MPSIRIVFELISYIDTSARVCDFSDWHVWGGGPFVSSQEDIDSLFKGCTEIQGNIAVASNYTGSLYLANVTSISGYIVTPDQDGVPLLTSIELPDLKYIDIISINTAPSLATISFPSLSTINTTFVLRDIGPCSVDFPLITSLPFLIITGNVKRYVA